MLAKLQTLRFIKDLPEEVSNCISIISNYIRRTGNAEESNEANLRLVYVDTMALINNYVYHQKMTMLTIFIKVFQVKALLTMSVRKVSSLSCGGYILET